MNKQLSFISNGKRYTTIVGADAYLQSAKEPGSNVVDCGKIQASGGLNTAFKRLFGKPLRDVPVIQNAVIQTVGAIYNVTGQALVDEELIDVSIFEDTIIIGNAKEAATTSVADVTNANAEVATNNETTSVNDEHTECNQTSIVSEQVVDGKLETTDKTEVVDVVEAEATSNDMAEAPELITETTRKPEEPVNLTGSNRCVEIGQDIEQDVVAMAKPGLYFGHVDKAVCNTTKGLVIGETSESVVGIIIGGKMYNPNTATVIASRNPFRKPDEHDRYFGQRPSYKPEQEFDEPLEQRVEKALQEQEKQNTTTPAVEDVPTLLVEKTDEDLMQDWKGSSIPDITKKWDTPKPVTEETISVVEEPVEDAVSVDTEAIKKQLRAKFSQEVNAVIGMIPHACLGNIAEFTSREVDTSALQDRGNLYCVDNRWNKCGAWFCIDVVQNTSRFFYNSKNKTMIEIPIGDCKAWLNAVK